MFQLQKVESSPRTKSEASSDLLYKIGYLSFAVSQYVLSVVIVKTIGFNSNILGGKKIAFSMDCMEV